MTEVISHLFDTSSLRLNWLSTPFLTLALITIIIVTKALNVVPEGWEGPYGYVDYLKVNICHASWFHAIGNSIAILFVSGAIEIILGHFFFLWILLLGIFVIPLFTNMNNVSWWKENDGRITSRLKYPGCGSSHLIYHSVVILCIALYFKAKHLPTKVIMVSLPFIVFIINSLGQSGWNFGNVHHWSLSGGFLLLPSLLLMT